MKRHIAMIIIISVFLIGIIICIFLYNDSINQKGININNIDNTKNLSIDFKNSKVLVIGWKKDYVKVIPSILVDESKIPVIIENEINNIKLDNFKPIALNKSFTYQIKVRLSLLKNEMNLLGYDFSVYVPKDIPVAITADILRAEGCKIAYVEGNHATIRDSEIIKGFLSDASTNSVRDCKISKDSIFKGKIIESRDNVYID